MRDPYEISDGPELILDAARMSADECTGIFLHSAINFLNTDGRWGS